MTMRVLIYLLIVLFACSCMEKNEQQNELKLWYDKPGENWMTEGLPLGNAYMGAMIFGGPEKEHIQFTEESLWAGGPRAHKDYNYGNKKGAYENLLKVRELLQKGEFEKAHRLAYDKVTGEYHPIAGGIPEFGDYGAQQTMGDLHVQVGGVDSAEEYKRDINLRQGTINVMYKSNGIMHQRRMYGSYQKRILVYEFKASRHVEYTVDLTTPHQVEKKALQKDVILLNGSLKNNGLAFGVRIKIKTNGKILEEDGVVKVIGATRMTLYHTAATEYKHEYPNYIGNDYLGQLESTLKSVEGLSEQEVYDEHLADYTQLFGRVEFDLAGPSRDTIPTDKRQKLYYEGAYDPCFESLYFQYNRYLMISGSRPGSMPLTLQGKWNNSMNPPWASDYHMNINQQMLYWPAEVTNLSECHVPLFDYMKGLVEPGQTSAKVHFNAGGWIVNTMNNAYGFTAPGWGFPWGFFPGGAAWLCQHTWEHYAFTQDTVFLKETAYPLMRGAAQFWMDYLIPNENGHLVSCPSYSPEHGGISTGASMDHQIAWDVLNNCISAAAVLGINDEFTQKAKLVKEQICPPMIGRWGQLQEWKEDVDDPDNKHRHISHLFALFPGQQISVSKTPKLAEAAKVSLLARGDGGTGWSRAWKIAFWARLKDGDHAYKMLHELLKPTDYTGVEMKMGNGTYSNLLCAHPPFQLDGNMGGTAGIAEMLIQSHAGMIEVLPALPSDWNTGSIKGLKARGGFIVDIEWKKGKLVKLKVLSAKGNECQIKYGEKLVSFASKAGETYVFNGKLKK
ncbi:glycoside hydrolase family 95 protein [Puteibacter caeruleilacunae]|nr:glycoside hydrolase family 95 protein [Puteibacter caeruleilacunae]